MPLLILKVGDAQQISSIAKSWIYTDLLIKPEEVVLYKPRKEGRLSLINLKLRALGELIKSTIKQVPLNNSEVFRRGGHLDTE